MKKNNYIIIAGCSRFGASIASILSAKGEDVVIIDIDKACFRKLSQNYSGFKLQGDATDIDVLMEAGIEKAKTIVAATDDDNTNIMIAQIAKIVFKVNKVVSRLYDIEKEVIYNKSDIQTIYPTKLTIDEFEKLVYEPSKYKNSGISRFRINGIRMEEA
ncbi:TrkA family potassium uptake protein [Clostridium sp. CCUG 7971]|uniref:potassium channel family protein n=1 Tax=Clostridium sp. CCUG 7971 TaxID=2811414 RepID=UPI001ABA49AC|nr:TrkA family potassium uptake protein [Clostridium sp. CCUG 7971]MBO3444418.1 TrkA family potassium uptake protein [Clostridium sp. CCUG 7971]